MTKNDKTHPPAVRSMTGYGQAAVELGAVRLAVEARSVNHRYADLRLRLPAELASHESRLRRRVLGRVGRGRIEVGVSLANLDGSEARPVLNRALVGEALAAARALRDEHGLAGEPDVSTILALSGVFRVEPPRLEWGDAERAALDGVLDAALEALDAERCREGRHLCEDLVVRLGAMQRLTDEVEARAAAMPGLVRDRLRERLDALRGEFDLDPQRVAQEAAYLAERCDVTEEVVRLRSHLLEARRLLERPELGALGKRLEFLLQEIHRETNTINSKSSDLELTRHALALKAEVEKVREQVQNVE